MAILPFDVTISVPQKKGVTVDAKQIAAEEEKTGFSVQDYAHSYLLQKLSKGKYTVDFQDVDKTNSLLSKSGVSYATMREKGKDELAKILGVDAVLGGKIKTSKPMSEGGAIAVAVLFGVGTSTNNVTANVTIHNGADGELLWKYDYQTSASIGSNPESLSKALMNNVAAKFPYKATKK